MELVEARHKDRQLLEYHAEIQRKDTRIAELEAQVAQMKMPWCHRMIR